MGNLVLAGATSGSITLEPTAVAGSNTITLPAATGTVMVSGNMPTFSAYAGGSNQTIANATATKIEYGTEFWDTNNCYDTTLYRFTPNVAGYYQVSARWNAAVAAASAGELFIYLYKNGSSYKRITNDTLNNNSVGLAVQGSCMVNMNGTTDYIECYIYQSSGSNLNSNYFAAEGSYFDACLIRSS